MFSFQRYGRYVFVRICGPSRGCKPPFGHTAFCSSGLIQFLNPSPGGQLCVQQQRDGPESGLRTVLLAADGYETRGGDGVVDGRGGLARGIKSSV